MFRSHGMVRESKSEALKSRYKSEWPDLNPDFIFAFPAYNVRSTEINAVIGPLAIEAARRRNKIRTRNLNCFLDGLDPKKYFTDFEREGSCNYAFTLVLREPDQALWDRIETTLRERKIEFRRGTSGGGNQLRQPFMRKLMPDEFKKYPQGEPRPFLRRLHRQLSRTGNRPHQGAVRVVEWNLIYEPAIRRPFRQR